MLTSEGRGRPWAAHGPRSSTLALGTWGSGHTCSHGVLATWLVFAVVASPPDGESHACLLIDKQ